ncbi:uracil-DNA glycosylase [Sphingomonas gilva]|uniref:Uracil-DNA glycosylase n=1 Tax=Sphingomonas gilva TaxID=2305907 RepID=A0A396RNB2_9SPHN|nr:uracil-DNA glycosylase family protein [Sphingomonas gilva]RHW17236.1 uracil-DNA glycosylase [Sphingomonas gilva]
MGFQGGNALASALDWWAEAGIDTLVDETPRNWLARTPQREVPTEPSPAETALPTTLEAFIAWRISAPDMPERAWTPRLIAPEGNAASGLFVLIDQPDDDALLAPAEARLFERMLAAIGRDLGAAYLAPLAHARVIVPPSSEARARLAELALHHIALAAPRMVLALGDAASRALTGLGLAEARGSLRAVNHLPGNFGVIATHHPRFLLDRPAMKAASWADLQLLKGGLSS